MQPIKILINLNATSLAAAFTAAGGKFNELTYGVCQAICTKQVLACYDDAGVAVGSKNTYGSAANVTACNMALDACARVCTFAASGGCDAI